MPGVIILPLRPVKPPDAGFTDIVPGGPYKIADDPGMILHRRPVIECLWRKGLRTKHDAAGFSLMPPEVIILPVKTIVIAAHVKSGKKRIFSCIWIVDGSGYRPGWIEGAYLIGELMRGAYNGRRLHAGYFIANAPQDDAGMVAVPQD